MFLIVFGERMLRTLSNFNCICYLKPGFWRALWLKIQYEF